MIILKIAITWIILDAIVCAGWSALKRRHYRARQSEASELADSMALGGAAVPFIHDHLIIEGANQDHV